jgi:hypothetical protein
MDDSVQKILLIAFGWLLGLLGPVVTDAVKRRRERKRVQATLLLELNELAFQLALTVFIRAARAVKLDRALLTWMLEAMTRHTGAPPTGPLPDAINKLLTQSDAVISRDTSIGYELGFRHHLLLQKTNAPLLDSRLSTLWYFPGPVQARLLVLRTHIDLLNQLVEQHNYYVGLMYSPEARNERKSSAINEALTECQDHYAEQARTVGDAIHELSCAV